MICIFCGKENEAMSVEHIVSESLGNEHYIMPLSSVCDDCNNHFSKFEEKVLAKTVLAVERARFAVISKKRRTSKGQINGLKIEGNEEYKMGQVKLVGINSDNFKDFNPITRIGSLHVATFDKSEVATSKFLLKIGLESIFKSKRAIYDKYDFTNLRDYLIGKTNHNWPFCVTDIEIRKFSSVPTMYDKYQLSRCHCQLRYLEIDSEILLFKFEYGGIPLTINLLCRSIKWIQDLYDIKDKDSKFDFEMINPEQFRRRIAVDEQDNPEVHANKEVCQL